MRIGHGYDVHRLEAGRELVVCGEKIAWETGLVGHSDADIGAHAAADALLGAVALGDIGKHFPDSDPAYKNADSMKLLAAVYQKIKAEGYILGNLDLTLVAQAPKFSPHTHAMRKNLAEVLETDEKNINVKATTEEKMGFTGRAEGMAAHAVCLLKHI